MNVTFYNEVVDPRIPEMQKKVFKALGLNIIQVNPKQWEGHGGTIDTFLDPLIKDLWGDQQEPIIIWDVDCIPLNSEVVRNAEELARKGMIVGIAQKASHIPNSIIYAGPAFLAFTMKTYKALGSPTFACTERSDCGGELTHKAIEKGIEVRLLYPSHVEEPLWELTNDMKFGKGTTFENSIYHAFLSRKGNTEPFLKKCEELLSK